MKVCTDSCLFGGWVTNKLQNLHPAYILDVGTGTGLLALMLIQKFSKAQIHAIEIDEETAKEAERNIENSKYRDVITLFNKDFNQFESPLSYNIIVCNPPFYSNQLVSPNQKKNMAMHSSDFSMRDLFTKSINLIAVDGILAVLIPYTRSKEIENIANETGWHPYIIANVKQSQGHDYFRTLILFQLKEQESIIEEICIRETEKEYSETFKHYLQDYYLYL